MQPFLFVERLIRKFIDRQIKENYNYCILTSYQDFTDDDLMEAYTSMMEYSGKPNDELLNEIHIRGGLDSFLKKLTQKEARLKEIERITKEVYQLRSNSFEIDDIKKQVSSNVLSKDELDDLIDSKVLNYQRHIRDTSIDLKTIIRSLLGTIVASLTGSLLWGASIRFFYGYHYLLLPIVCIIIFIAVQLISGKSTNNLLVFIGSFIATVISFFLGFYFATILLA